MRCSCSRFYTDRRPFYIDRRPFGLAQLLVCVLVSVLALSGAGGAASPPSTYTVSDLADPEALHRAANATAELVVYFYATWCTPCATFGPVFEKVAVEAADPGVLDFARFDGGGNRDFAGPLVGDRYPAVALYRDGEFYVHAQFEATPEGLSSWLDQFTGDPVKILSNKSDAVAAAKKSRTTFVIEYPVNNRNVLNELITMARDRRHYGKYIAVPSAENGSTLDVTVFHQHEEPLSLSSDRPEGSSVSGSLVTVDELFGWCDQHRFPLLGEVDAANQYLYYMRGLDPLMIFGPADQMERDGSKWRQLAVAFPNLSFMWFNTDKEAAKHAARALGLSNSHFPAFVSFTGTGEAPRKRKRYIFNHMQQTATEQQTAGEQQIARDDKGSTKSSLSLSALTAWLSSVTSGEARPRVLSTSAIPSDRSFQLERVSWVTGAGFDQMVDPSPANDYLLLLTGPRGTDLFPGCRKCETVLQMADALLAEHPDLPLHIGELFITANEIPFASDQWVGTWDVTDLPVGLFVPASTKAEAVPLSKMAVVEWKLLEPNVADILERWARDTNLFKTEANAVAQQHRTAKDNKHLPSMRDEL